MGSCKFILKRWSGDKISQNKQQPITSSTQDRAVYTFISQTKKTTDRWSE